MTLPNENVTQDWIGYLEAQRFSGLNGETLRRLIRNGQLRATKIGQDTKIAKRSLEAYVENHPTQPKLPGFEEGDR